MHNEPDSWASTGCESSEPITTESILAAVEKMRALGPMPRPPVFVVPMGYVASLEKVNRPLTPFESLCGTCRVIESPHVDRVVPLPAEVFDTPSIGPFYERLP